MSVQLNAYALKACGKPIGKGEITSLIINENFIGANWVQNWREIAKEAQELTENNVAIDTGIHLTFNVRVRVFQHLLLFSIKLIIRIKNVS